MNIQRITDKLFEAKDVASLVYFRIAFGLIMLWEVTRYFSHKWIYFYWIKPDFFFTYEGFSWIKPWSGDGMYFHFYILGFLAICITLGFFYKAASILFFIGFTFVFLLDKTNYLNHFYLLSLLSFIMIFLPANKSLSLDVLLFPSLKSNQIPAWPIYWLRVMLGIAYLFGGIAKLNKDWFVGEPIGFWMSRKTSFPIIGQWFEEDWMVKLFSLGGVGLDLLIFPLLLFKQTRIFGLVSITLFHVINSQLFQIGIFPWFMIAATLIFLPSKRFRFWQKIDFNERTIFPKNKKTIYLLALFILIQILVPLRHHLFKGNVNWTEEGHRFSWRMKLNRKNAHLKLNTVDSVTGEKKNVKISTYLSPRQIRVMKTRPDMILQFAQYAARLEEEKSGNPTAIFAESEIGLNGRERSVFIDPEVDLSVISYPFYKKADWIMPLQEK